MNPLAIETNRTPDIPIFIYYCMRAYRCISLQPPAKVRVANWTFTSSCQTESKHYRVVAPRDTCGGLAWFLRQVRSQARKRRGGGVCCFFSPSLFSYPPSFRRELVKQKRVTAAPPRHRVTGATVRAARYPTWRTAGQGLNQVDGRGTEPSRHPRLASQ